jgi:hypothetical protein
MQPRYSKEQFYWSAGLATSKAGAAGELSSGGLLE